MSVDVWNSNILFLTLILRAPFQALVGEATIKAR